MRIRKRSFAGAYPGHPGFWSGSHWQRCGRRTARSRRPMQLKHSNFPHILASLRPTHRSLRTRHLAAHLGRRLIFAQSFMDHLPQQIVTGQVRYFTYATSSGRTQCTRLSTSGDPKRLPRGGGTSSGILSVASGCSLRHSLCSSAWLMPEPTLPAKMRRPYGP